MAGDKIVTAENATWMIHEAWGGAMGNAGDMRAIADVLDGENKAIAGIYAARTGQPASSFWTRPAPSAADPSPAATGLMASDNWMSAEEALDR
jgi:ATP-dependent protease ClpP protease subunit